MRKTSSLVCVRLINAPYLLIGLRGLEEARGNSIAIESNITLFYAVLGREGKLPSGYKAAGF